MSRCIKAKPPPGLQAALDGSVLSVYGGSLRTSDALLCVQVSLSKAPVGTWTGCQSMPNSRKQSSPASSGWEAADMQFSSST